MRGLGQNYNYDDAYDADWRYADSNDIKEGFRFNDIIGALKKLKPKKMTKGSKLIATIWRGINWFIVWRILCALITFLFKYTFIGVLAYVAPGIPWAGALKMVLFFFALNIAFNASAETDKDKFRFGAAVALSAIPTIFLMFAGEMGLFNLFIAGCISFSAYREKIYTDARVRRTPPKKKRRELHTTDDGHIILDEYNV